MMSQIDEESQASNQPDSPSPLIICENLVKIYKVAELEVVALQGLDLVIERGEIMGIVGPSGSGKSSLMNILGGLDRPSAGQVWVDGHDLLKMSNAALNHYRRANVGFVWQQSARNLIPYMNAQANVELPLTLAGFAGRKKQTRATELLEMVGLAERRHHRLNELSGGEQQRVAIAVALANNPALLLADEPTGELDSTTAETIYQTFRDLNQALGLTILIVSHDPNIARQVERVVAIRDGKMATETVRHAVSDTEANDRQQSNGDDGSETYFEELVVLDSAGRLQIPQEYREQLNINRRVQLEVVEDGILIKPVSSDDRQPVETTVIAEQSRRAETTGIRKFLNRFRRSKVGDGR